MEVCNKERFVAKCDCNFCKTKPRSSYLANPPSVYKGEEDEKMKRSEADQSCRHGCATPCKIYISNKPLTKELNRYSVLLYFNFNFPCIIR